MYVYLRGYQTWFGINGDVERMKNTPIFIKDFCKDLHSHKNGTEMLFGMGP